VQAARFRLKPQKKGHNQDLCRFLTDRKSKLPRGWESAGELVFRGRRGRGSKEWEGRTIVFGPRLLYIRFRINYGKRGMQFDAQRTSDQDADPNERLALAL